MLERTHIPEARWVEGADKKKARLNCISHLLKQVPYGEVPREPIVLPEREHKPDYVRHPVAKELYVQRSISVGQPSGCHITCARRAAETPARRQSSSQWTSCTTIPAPAGGILSHF